MHTLHKNKDSTYALQKGAAEKVLSSCKYIDIEGGKQELSKDTRKEIEDKINEYAGNSERVLAFAYKHESNDLESISTMSTDDYVFLGLISIYEPPRPQVLYAVTQAKSAGVDIVLVSGDYPLTVRAKACEVGITGSSAKVITGHDLKDYSDIKLKSLLNNNKGNIHFARMFPEQKLRVV